MKTALFASAGLAVAAIATLGFAICFQADRADDASGVIWLDVAPKSARPV